MNSQYTMCNIVCEQAEKIYIYIYSSELTLFCLQWCLLVNHQRTLSGPLRDHHWKDLNGLWEQGIDLLDDIQTKDGDWRGGKEATFIL